MRKFVSTAAGTVAIGTLSASIALAGGGVSGVAKGHGEAVSEVAQAVETVEGLTHGAAVSAIAKLHGKQVSEAARAQGGGGAASGKGKAASDAKGGNANRTDEPGGLKGGTRS